MKTDYISREAARDLMYHNQDALTEYDLDSIPAADVVSVAGYKRQYSDSTLIRMPKKELVRYVRIAEAARHSAEVRLRQQAINMMGWEPVRHAEWEWFEELNGNPLEGEDRDWGWRCSGCKTVLPDDYDDPDRKPGLKYCAECGAKMDGGGTK